jgi:hypothetical protein
VTLADGTVGLGQCGTPWKDANEAAWVEALLHDAIAQPAIGTDASRLAVVEESLWEEVSVTPASPAPGTASLTLTLAVAHIEPTSNSTTRTPARSTTGRYPDSIRRCGTPLPSARRCPSATTSANRISTPASPAQLPFPCVSSTCTTRVRTRKTMKRGRKVMRRGRDESVAERSHCSASGEETSAGCRMLTLISTRHPELPHMIVPCLLFLLYRLC